MDMISNVIVYIEDLLIRTQTHEQHLNKLEVAMQRLKDTHMKTNVNKYLFYWNYRSLLHGFTLSGIKPGKDQLKAVEAANILKPRRRPSLS